MGNSSWSDNDKPMTESGPAVPTTDHKNDTIASPTVSAAATDYATTHTPPAPIEEEEEWPVGGGKWPERQVTHYETDEGPAVATHDPSSDTLVDWDDLNPKYGS